MDPLAALTSALGGVQQVSARALDLGPSPALTALVGQELQLLLSGQGEEGLQLTLPSGQVLNAKGQLPYAEGSLLRVKVLPGADGGLRLVTLEARPAPPPSLLAPLLQGEGASLLARLMNPTEEVAPLARLLTLLADAAAPTGEAALAPALARLTSRDAQALARALQLPAGASGDDLAKALVTWLRSGGDASVQEQVARLQSALDRAGFPERREGLGDWLASILRRTPEEPEAPAQARSQAPQAQTPRSPLLAPSPREARAAQAAALDPALRQLQSEVRSHPGRAAELPDSWEAWIRGSLRTLSDPAASPREAPFHAAQAKEGTAFFEVPLPWVPQSPMHLWVEDGEEEDERGRPRQTQRVLLGLTFSNLGETRVGLSLQGRRLQARIWTEHPELLASDVQAISEELEGTGLRTDLRVLPLAPGPTGVIPSLRSVVVGTTLEAMG